MRQQYPCIKQDPNLAPSSDLKLHHHAHTHRHSVHPSDHPAGVSAAETQRLLHHHVEDINAATGTAGPAVVDLIGLRHFEVSR